MADKLLYLLELQIITSWERREISWRSNVDLKNILKVELWKQTNPGFYSIRTNAEIYTYAGIIFCTNVVQERILHKKIQEL